MLKMILCDPQKLNRTTLKELLEKDAGVKVIVECETAEQGLRATREHDPDLVLLDGSIAGMGVIEMCRRLRRVSATVQTIVLGAQKSGPFVLKTLEAGADGYLTRCSAFPELVDAIRRVSRGERYVCAESARVLALSAAGSDLSPLGRLTAREMAVLVMVSRGQRRQEISRHLSLSPKTVSTYRSRILKKLGLRTDVELTHLSISHGLLDA